MRTMSRDHSPNNISGIKLGSQNLRADLLAEKRVASAKNIE